MTRRCTGCASRRPSATQKLNEVSRKQVQLFHNRLLTDGLKPASADHVLKLMRRAFNLAVEWEILETSPLTRLQLFNPDNRMENYLSPEQLDKLVTCCVLPRRVPSAMSPSSCSRPAPA